MFQDLFYRPDIKDTRTYKSDYEPVIKYDDIVNEPVPLDNGDTIQKIIRKSTNIYKISEDLSANVFDVVKIMLNTVKSTAENIITIEEMPKLIISDPLVFNSGIEFASKQIELEPISLESFEIPQLDYTLPDLEIEMESYETTIDKIESQYNANIANISNDFLDKLSRVLEKYVYELLTLRGESGIFFNEEINVPVDCDSVALKDESLQCYLDLLGKSQMLKDQKMRLFKKTHSVDESLFHLQNVDTAYQQYKRYYTQKKMNEESYVQTSCNELLDDMVRQSKAKLNNAQKNLYKYYNSAVRVVEDYMDTQMKEIKCKTLLLIKGEELYKSSSTDESENTDNTDDNKNTVSSEINKAADKISKKVNS